MAIHAVFENGVFRTIDKVDFLDPCNVEIEVREVKTEPKSPTLDDVYAILGRRHASGEHDLGGEAQ
ncbi:MAG TPA: antitoxin family protein [Gemmataceae bacterium]|nr:antitoxin family protein [Gemmataceae bacterium]